MKTSILPLLLAALLPVATACSHQVRPVQATAQLRRDIGEEVAVQPTHGRTYAARIVGSEGEAVVLDTPTGRRVVPFDEVRTISRVSHGRGAMEGLLLGGAGTIAVLTLLEGGASAWDDDGRGYGPPKSFFIVGFGLLGGLIGTAIGAAGGSVTTIRF
jgi:hypothetical protein